MRGAFQMANRLAPLLLLVMAMLARTVASSGTFANSIHRTGRFSAEILTTNVTEDGSPFTCLRICIDHNTRDNGSCRAFNFQSSTRTCEVLSEALCDGNEMLQLSKDDNSWHYYDITDDPGKENRLDFRETPYCTEEGKCSEKCERHLNSTCIYDEQCTAVTKNSYCTAVDVTTPGICKCKEHYWAYNSSLCIRQISFGFPVGWLHKKIVNNMCSMTFTVKTKAAFVMRFMSDIDVRPNIPRYDMYVGHSSNKLTNLYKRASGSTLVKSISSPGIITQNFQNFSVSWCNAVFSFGKQGQSPLLQWTDATPYNILGLGFYRNGADNHIFIPHNLVDSSFPTDIETGELRGNGYDWHQVKINSDGSVANDINFLFEYKSTVFCRIRFTHKWNMNHRYHVDFGVNNLQTRLYNGRVNKWVQIVDGPNLLDNTFKRFWINVKGNFITAGKDFDLTPIINYTDAGLNPRFSHISISHCCGHKASYFKILSHPQFHEYPKGGYI